MYANGEWPEVESPPEPSKDDPYPNGRFNHKLALAVQGFTTVAALGTGRWGWVVCLIAFMLLMELIDRKYLRKKVDNG